MHHVTTLVPLPVHSFWLFPFHSFFPSLSFEEAIERRNNNSGGGGLYKLGFLHFKFCREFLYAIYLAFLRICAGVRARGFV